MMMVFWNIGTLRLLFFFFVSFRHRGTSVKETGAEHSDQAGGRGEGAPAARHPSALWETEPRQWEPVAKTCSSGCIWPHHRWNRGCVHEGAFLPDVLRVPLLFCGTAVCTKWAKTPWTSQSSHKQVLQKRSLLKNNSLLTPATFLFVFNYTSSPLHVVRVASYVGLSVWCVTSSFVPPCRF